MEFLREISDTSRKQLIPVLGDSNERSEVESSGFVQEEYHWSWGESEASWSAVGELICPKWPLKLAHRGWVLAWTRGHRERMGSWGSHQLKDQVSGLQGRTIGGEKNFQSSGPKGQVLIDLGRGARALRVEPRGLCEAFPGSLGLASHDLPGSRKRALIFHMRALEREDSTDFRVPALGRGC